MSEEGINIDMTPVKSGERYFYVWSHRKNIGTPLDTGSMLMIAEFDPVHPERLISEPKCLSRPLYGFENTEHTINNEGPYSPGMVAKLAIGVFAFSHTDKSPRVDVIVE